MSKRVSEADSEIIALNRSAEAQANGYSLRFLAILCLFVILCEVLNEMGLFTAEPRVMHTCAVLAFTVFFIPLAVYLLHDHAMKKKPTILENYGFKYVVIACTFLGVVVLGILLSFHAVLMLAIPPLIASQYRDTHRGKKHLISVTFIATLLMVPITIYGNFFFGMPDRNLIKGALSDEEALFLVNRLRIATPKRMWELFTHYVLPRTIAICAVVGLASAINGRNGNMLKAQEDLSRQLNEEMQRRINMKNRVIDALATLIENRDEDTGEHIVRTKLYVTMIAEAMRKRPEYKDVLTDEVLTNIENAAPLHDIGKIAVSDAILLKPARLTPEEFEQMKLHTVKGSGMIRYVFASMEDETFLKTAEEIALSHHEKWNGKGYPNGLAGEDIPLAARIMAVADVYDALVSVRVYKPSVSPEKALEIMFADSGTHFDPHIMECVDAIRDELIHVAKSSVEELEA